MEAVIPPTELMPLCSLCRARRNGTGQPHLLAVWFPPAGKWDELSEACLGCIIIAKAVALFKESNWGGPNNVTVMWQASAARQVSYQRITQGFTVHDHIRS